MLAAETNTAWPTPSPQAPSVCSPNWAQIVEGVDPFLQAVSKRLTDQVDAFEPEIAAHVRYVLANQGKQLRPALVAFSARTVGATTTDLVTVAAIIEMVHLATLVHDDVMDVARLRRCRPTLAAKVGNSLSILVGDCLFAHALELASAFPTPAICRSVSAATKTVCTGETLQTLQERRLDLSRADYLRILRMKTGALFALSCSLGAQLAGAPSHVEQALHNYGLSLGTAYQVYDDCLDLFGQEAEAGKSLGTDLEAGKLTLPVIIALEQAKTTPEDRHALEELILHWHPSHLPALLALLETHGALAASIDVIGRFCQSARDALSPLPPTQGGNDLMRISQFLGHQSAALRIPC